MLISFRKFIQKCVHEENFHNRIEENKISKLFSLIQEKFKDWNSKSFSRIKEENNKNCRDLSYGEKLKISRKFKHYGDFQIVEDLLLNSGDLWQFPIDNKIRLVGILKENHIKTKDKSEDDLLYVLFFDSEHIRYPSNKEEDKVKEEDLFCIMEGIKDCNYNKNIFVEKK